MHYNVSFKEPSDFPNFYEEPGWDSKEIDVLQDTKSACMQEFDRASGQIIRESKFRNYCYLPRSSRVLLCCVFYASLSTEEQRHVMREAMTPEFFASIMQIDDIVIKNVRAVQDAIVQIIEHTVEIYYNRRCKILFKAG